METLIALVQNFGFPVAVCAWFMLRTEKVIGNNTKAMTNFAVTIEHCKQKGK